MPIKLYLQKKIEKSSRKQKFNSISELGEFKLIEKLTETFEIVNDSTELGVGDDAAILDFAKIIKLLFQPICWLKVFTSI